MSKTTNLQEELAKRILSLLNAYGAQPGYRLREVALSQQLEVSRTPLRAALRLLVSRGIARPSQHRGIELAVQLDELQIGHYQPKPDETDKKIFIALANARSSGKIGIECTQQEIVRVLDAKLASVIRGLHQLAELGLVRKKPGFGWSFEPSAYITLTRESYYFRRALEPEALLEPNIQISTEWIQSMKERHLELRRKPWEKEDARIFHELNSDFHEELVNFCGNLYIIKAIRDQIRLRRFLTPQLDYGEHRVHGAINEHLEILDALERGDRKEASLIMRQHVSTGSHFMPKIGRRI